MSTNWIMNYAVVQVTLPGIQNIGWKFWIIWAVICFSFIPVTYFFYPETANRYVTFYQILSAFGSVGEDITDEVGSTLEDIDRFFETNPGVFVHRNKLAVQLHRPAEFVEADERIATTALGGEGKVVGEKQGVVEMEEAV